MIFQAAIADRLIELDVRTENGRPVVNIAGHQPDLDLVRLSEYSYSLLLDGHSHHLSIRTARDGYLVILRQQTYHIQLLTEIELTIERMGLKGTSGNRGGVVPAPIPGLITKIAVAEGDTVAQGDQLLILEAMKMENEIIAPQSGTVSAVHVQAGQTVEKGAKMVEITGTD